MARGPAAGVSEEEGESVLGGTARAEAIKTSGPKIRSPIW